MRWPTRSITTLILAGVLPSLGMRGAVPETNSWLSYRYAPDALKEVDLASNTDWTLSVDGGRPRPIKVTAGGWNSDQQSPQIPSAEVKDYVVYERSITIPAEAKDQVVKLLFGGCNYGAEVYLNEQKIAEHHATMTPFEADVTAVAKPGETQRLKVKAYTRGHYGNPSIVPGGFDYNKGMSGRKCYDGDTKYAYGLIGYVRLALYPPVHVEDVFVRPSVSSKALAYDVWIANGTARQQSVTLKGKLSAWAETGWDYPALPDRVVVLPPGRTVKVTIEGVSWPLGPESYWWPNIPFREPYSPTLHWLNLTLEEAGRPLHQLRQRFGFAEHQEGPFYYTINGVRYTSLADSNAYGQIGEFDCWSETAAFQPPHGEVKGCSETWRRYQRIGFNSMRLHQSVPTRYMLETADEAGFLLMPEGAGRAAAAKFDKDKWTSQIQAMVQVSRNHPSVARYSLSNESTPVDYASPKNEKRWLIDAALEMDPTRPLVFEVCNCRSGAVPGMETGHAFQMEHYVPVVKGGDHIRGLGECAWATDGMASFVNQALAVRLNDWTHIAPWSWLNYWPNFLEGMNAARHPWKSNDYGDRKDGVDGWGSPIVQAVQWALQPYLVIDRGLLGLNPAIKENSKSGKIDWPYRMPIYAAGAKVERKIEVFNGGLSGNQFELKWSLHWDSPSGPLASEGAVGPFQIEPGFHATQKVTFEAPNPEAEERTLYLVLESVKDGKVVCHDEHSRLTVTTRPVPPAEAAFAGVDESTQGDWQGKYGKGGYWLARMHSKFPVETGVDLGHLIGKAWTLECNDPRALVRDDGKKRIAGCWYGPVRFPLHLGREPRIVTFYFLDWNAKKREQTVRIRTQDGRLLDERAVSDFQNGKYLTWKIRGSVLVDIQQTGGTEDTNTQGPVLSAVFVD